MDVLEKNNSSIVIREERFLQSLKYGRCKDADYMHAKREYHDLYVQSNTLFLADEFENFKKMCLKISCSFPFCTRISIASRLKKSKVSII